MKRSLYIASILAGVALATPVFAYTSPGQPQGYVSDFAHALSAPAVQALDQQLSAFEASTSNQIAVVTVPDMGGDYVENYAVKLFADWGIGSKEHDNGVLLLLAIKEHAIRIEVGYGLEGALPDSVAQSIINTDLAPNLKAGKFDEGVAAAAQDIMLATQNEYTGASSAESAPSHINYGAVFVFVFFALQWVAAVLARSRSWWAGGIVGGVLGLLVWWFFSFVLVWGLVSVAGLVVLGLGLDYVVSKTYTHKKLTGAVMPWWIGGGGGPWRGGGGGFGGFGGGRSGGGGASGGW